MPAIVFQAIALGGVEVQEEGSSPSVGGLGPVEAGFGVSGCPGVS